MITVTCIAGNNSFCCPAMILEDAMGVSFIIGDVTTLQADAVVNVINFEMEDGGSDYHGRNKKHLHLGMLNKDDAIVTEDKLNVLKLLG